MVITQDTSWGGTQEEIPSLDGSPAGVQHIFISFLSKDNKIF